MSLYLYKRGNYMNAQTNLLEWNNLFISISLKIGKIYFETSDMDLTLSKAHKEERWRWVDKTFIQEAEEIYVWLLNHPSQENNARSCSFEYLYYHVKENPFSPLIPKIIESGYFKQYLGKDYDIFCHIMAEL